MSLVIGTDPESFAVNDEGICIPPVMLRRQGLNVIRTEYTESGTPHPVFYDDGNIKVIEDGVAMEYTIAPTNDPAVMYKMFNEAIEIADNLVARYGVKIVAKPVIPFNFHALGLSEADDEAHQSCIFGCDASLNIYSGEFSKIRAVVTLPHRFAGGHIHVSPVPHALFVPFTQLMDILVGSAIVVMATDQEAERTRNRFYGEPGTIRLQNYPNDIEGIEYRPPSVSWLSSEDSVSKIHGMIHNVMKLMGSKKDAREVINIYLEQAKYALNEYDKEIAGEILNGLGVSV